MNPLLGAARSLSRTLAGLSFPAPVAHVYDPLQYAWEPHARYLSLYAQGPKRVVFLGMNPGPFGMMQTGVPFGEIRAVQDWLEISGTVTAPPKQHPKRPIEGYACRRTEISGQRLWGWAAARFGTAAKFFSECTVLNYCPLVFLEASGRNLTPDKLPADVRRAVYAACDQHLAQALRALQPQWVIGIGKFAEQRARTVIESATDASPMKAIRLDAVLHPSPASPLANRGWAAAVDLKLKQLGVFGAETEAL